MSSEASAEAEVRSTCERAWAAGFFDGEGWAGAAAPRGRRTTQPHAQINQSGSDGLPEVLRRFAAAVGTGRLSPSYTKPGGRPMFRWVASSRADVSRAFSALSPSLATPKRRQFERALDIVNVSDRVDDRPEEEELAWAAGLWDGEGSTSLIRHQSHAGYFIAEMALTQAGESGPPEVLERLASLLEGKIYGPFRSRTPKAVYRWKLFGLARQQAAIGRLAPHLGTIKLEQAMRAFAIVGSQPSLPRGRPEWGCRKERCINGHEYDTARVRPYRARSADGVERRASKQCLVCTREQAKARRAVSRSTSSRSTSD